MRLTILYRFYIEKFPPAVKNASVKLSGQFGKPNTLAYRVHKYNNVVEDAVYMQNKGIYATR